MGDAAAALRKARAAADALQADLDRALGRLGAEPPSLEQLRTAEWPSARAISTCLADRQSLLQDLKAALQRRDELAASLARKELEVQQYRQRHRPATWDDVAQARQQRDHSWQEIMSGRASLEQLAGEFESRMRAADDLADSRHDKAQEAARLQSLEDQQQQETLGLKIGRAHV